MTPTLLQMQITLTPEFLANESDPNAGVFMFAYHVKAVNTGQMPVQIISRYWRITDGNGKVEEVRGLGVVGHQPLLRPNEGFEYTSGCPLPTPVGSMSGHFFCVAEDGTRFEAQIAEFVLAMPRTLH